MKMHRISIAFLAIAIVGFTFFIPASVRAEGNINVLWDGCAYDINERGQIVGSKLISSLSDHRNAVLWDKGELITLWDDGEAKAINDRGQVVGNKSNSLGDNPDAVMWDKGELITLWEDGVANAINERGQVAGNKWTNGLGHDWAVVLWDKGELITLWEGKANDINDPGQVVGSVVTKWGDLPGIWDNGELTTLAGIIKSGGDGATAINNKGQVVGINNVGQKWLWYKTGHSTVLSIGMFSFYPIDINEQGQILGSEAMLWDKGDQSVLWEGNAYSMNNQSQVVGAIYVDGKPKAVLWQKK